MLHDIMDLSRLMVHAQQDEDSRLRKNNRKSKNARSFESSFTNNGLDVQDNPKSKKTFSNQVPSNFSKNCNDRGSNPNLNRGEMLIHQKRDQLVLSVVRNMRVNVFLELIVAMVVTMVVIW